MRHLYWATRMGPLEEEKPALTPHTTRPRMRRARLGEEEMVSQPSPARTLEASSDLLAPNLPPQ